MISIVISMFNEEDNVKLLYKKLKTIMKRIGKDYEIIFIDDGSNDNTYKILEDLSKKDKKIKVIKFRKNFGQTSAIQAGFDHSKGDIIITIDGDLQNDPEDIEKFLEKIKEGYDVVNGWRYERKDNFQKRIFSKFSNWLARKLTGLEIHDFGCTFKAYKKDIIKDIKLYGEMHRYIPAIVATSGAKITEIKIKHHPRKFGNTKYGIGRLLKGFLDLLFIKFWMDFSSRPLHLFGFFGIFQFILGLLVGFYNIIRYGLALQVGPLLFLSAFLIFNGIFFVMFGFIGEILIRIYYSSKDETHYKIERILN